MRQAILWVIAYCTEMRNARRCVEDTSLIARAMELAEVPGGADVGRLLDSRDRYLRVG